MRIWNMVLSAIVVIAVLLTTVPFIVVSLGVFVDTGVSGYYRGEDLYELNRGHTGVVIEKSALIITGQRRKTQ